MPCKDCQGSQSLDQTLSDDTKNLDIFDATESECRCSACSPRRPVESSGCSCCNRQSYRRRNCRCCPCRSCCSCCTCCSTGRGVCAGLRTEQVGSGCTSCAAKKEEVKPKPKVIEEVTDSCKCCEAKQEVTRKKVCASCGCDKCA